MRRIKTLLSPSPSRSSFDPEFPSCSFLQYHNNTISMLTQRTGFEPTLTSSLMGTALFRNAARAQHSSSPPLRALYSTAGPPPPPPSSGPPPPTPRPVPPPGTAANGAHLAASAAGAASRASTAASSAASTLRGWSAVRASPFKHLFTFGALHVTIAQLSLIPAYAFLHYSGIGNTLLAGPQAAYLLQRPLPSWAISSLGLKQPSTLEGGKLAKGPTVEDALEVGLKRVASGAWASGGAVFRLIGGFQKSFDKEDPVGSLANIANETKKLRSSDAKEGAEEADRAIDSLKRKKSWTGSAKEKLGGRARDIAGDVKLAQVRDALGAWVIVKVSRYLGNRRCGLVDCRCVRSRSSSLGARVPPRHLV